MIIETRYRDIPFEEAVKCASEKQKEFADMRETWDGEMRGQQVLIDVPALELEKSDYAICGGPFYLVLGGVRMVCPHIAEIGD